jgi:hypothetical protein
VGSCEEEHMSRYAITAYIRIGVSMQWSNMYGSVASRIFAFSLIEEYWSKVAHKEISPHLEKAVP